MVSQIDGCWPRNGCRVFAGECVIWKEFKGCLCHHSAWVTLKSVGIDVSHHHFRFGLMDMPVEFVEADCAAVQLMHTIEILIHFVVFPIQIEPSISDSITDSSD